MPLISEAGKASVPRLMSAATALAVTVHSGNTGDIHTLFPPCTQPLVTALPEICFKGAGVASAALATPQAVSSLCHQSYLFFSTSVAVELQGLFACTWEGRQWAFHVLPQVCMCILQPSATIS